MHSTFADQLVSMADHDLAVRARLASDGSLFHGYHPEMRAVHEENAAALEHIIAQSGWPRADLVGEQGAEAAWLIVQHAIGWPAFQRRCLDLLQREASAGRIPAWQPARLLDRIRTFEGRPQVYGTSFDWDDAGQMSPLPIEDAERVDERRARVGLEPLADAVARHRIQTAAEPLPKDLVQRRRQADEWARAVGWR
jgi:hypothetical protein